VKNRTVKNVNAKKVAKKIALNNNEKKKKSKTKITEKRKKN